MRRFVSLWPAVASVVLVLAAFPPFNLSLLSFVGLTPLLFALQKASSRRALALGYLFGFIFILAQMHMIDTLVVRWTGNGPLAFGTWLLCGFLGAWYFALFCWLAKRAFDRGWPWLIPIVWAGVEVFRSYIPGLEFPWGLLAEPLWPFPSIIQSAYFGSIFLVSAWCALCSLVLALWLRGDRFRELRPYATAILLVLALSFVRLSTAEPTAKKVITVGQTGVDMAFGDPSEQEQQVKDAVTFLSAAAIDQNSDLLVLPEGIAGKQGFPPHPPFPITQRVPVIFGGQRGDQPTYQTAFSYDQEKWQYADKTRLVIFGEYVPLRNYLPFLSAFQLPNGDLTPGDRLSLLDIRGMKVGPLICFEGLFPDLAYRQARAGARMLAVLSIDDWYQGTSAPDQLRSSSVWRSVETGLPLVRAASLGYSIAVDMHGNVLGEIPWDRQESMRIELPVPDKPDPFALFPVFPIVSFGSLLFAISLPWLPSGKTRSGSQRNRPQNERLANDSARGS